MTLIVSATLIYFNNEMLLDVYSYTSDICYEIANLWVQVYQFSSLKILAHRALMSLNP